MIVINTDKYNGTMKGANSMFWANKILSGQHAGKYATSENALKEFPELFKTEPYDVVELDAKAFEIDYTPPQMSNKGVVIPTYWEDFFEDDKFICGGFVVDLVRINTELVVDIAYLKWKSFQEELDKEHNKDLKRALRPIWLYVEQQIINGNTIEI
jgi:hypothetical protein